MNRYETYKPSGIEWIGEIPNHWYLKKLKYLLSEKLKYGANEISEYEEEKDPRYIRITDFGENGILRKDTFKSLPFDIAKDYLLKDGDILFARSGATVGKTFQFKNFSGIACFAGYLIKASPDSNQIHSDFLYYYTKSGLYENWKNSIFIQATIQNIGADKYRLLEIPIPPIEEQNTISNFLDEKTTQIDKLISNKRKLIELLKEERTAIINDAVSGKGKNWERKKLKYLVSEKLKYGANEPAEFEVLTDPRYFRITDFGDDGILREDTFKSLPFETAKDFLLNDGDILFARSGATVGKTFQFKNFSGIACFAGYLIKASPDSNQILTDFLYYYTKSSFYENWKNSIFIQATIQNIGADKYSLLEFPVPTLIEQKAIVQHIQTETQRIDNTIFKIEKEIELMNEYRTALISEVVTGKIKVA